MSASEQLAAQQLIERLVRKRQKLVLAESCTCGMTVAMLGGIPGASNVLCGSLVTYRETSKTQWLGVSADLIATFSAESREVTDAMAIAAWQHTSEADWAVSVTGHLGPNAPTNKDGVVMSSLVGPTGTLADTMTWQLRSSERRQRQMEAAERLIQWVLDSLRV